MRTRQIALTAAAIAVLGAGGATAATELGKGDVTSREIKNRTIRTKDLKPKARPLAKAKLAQVIEDVVTDPATGITIKVQGEKGDPGEQGPAGPQGPSGIAGVQIREATGAELAPGGRGSAQAFCEEGETVIGGGGRFTGTDTAPLLQSRAAGVDRWLVEYSNPGPSTGTVVAQAICAKVG